MYYLWDMENKTDKQMVVWLTLLVILFCIAAYVMHLNGEEVYCPCGTTEVIQVRK
jgi:hypothetical protein